MAFLKTTKGQWTALVVIVLVSATMMYFAFSPYSLFGLREPFAGGLPPAGQLVPFLTDKFPRSSSNKNLTNIVGNGRFTA